MRIVAQREDIVGAYGVLTGVLLLLIGVQRRRRVEGVDAAVQVDVVDQLVQVSIPVVGVLVLEVSAARPHLVFCETRYKITQT
eukprot:6201376-Pleurochrysis_carterae.AAC.1